MPTWSIIMLVVMGVLIIALVVLYILGKRMQKRQETQEVEMRKQAQVMNLYIIDKKKLRLKNSGLPKIVYESAPKLARIGRVPILKVKAANRVLSLMCDNEVYKTILPKQEVRAQVAGMYVIAAKRIRGPVPEISKRKKREQNFLDKLR